LSFTAYKQYYKQMAQEQRENYLKDMEAWRKQFSGMKRKPHIIHKHGRRPDRPRLPLNCYFVFKQDVEPRLIKERPELRGSSRSNVLGQM